MEHKNMSGKVCSCNIISFSDDAKAFSRFVCHCYFCQSYMSDDYNDESFFTANKVSIIKPEQIEFRRNYFQHSPVSRGFCKECQKPVLSIASSPIDKFYLIPSELVQANNVELSEVSAHVFTIEVELTSMMKYRNIAAFWKAKS